MNSLELFDTYEPYYAGRERSMPTGHREQADKRRDQKNGGDELSSKEQQPTH